MFKIVFALMVGAPLMAVSQTAPSPRPVPTSSSAVTSSPLPAASPSSSPSPSPTPLPTPLVLPAAAAPQIIAVSVNETVFHSGDTITATVITSTNVPAVELRVMGKVIRFARVDFGVFQLIYKLPHIPRRYLKDYPAQIVAMNTIDVYVARNITISFR